MTVLTPASDFAVYLRAQLTGEPTIFVQGFPANPDDVIATLVTGGGSQRLAMGMVVVTQEFSVQVLTRGARARGRETEALMRLVHTELQALANVTMDATTYALVTAAGEPAFLSTDLEGRPIWAANYNVIFVEA